MHLVELTAVPASALPVAPLRDHLRLGTGFTDSSLQDGLLDGFLRAALAAVEGRTGKALLARAFAMTLDAWRTPTRQPFPVAPVTAVTAVSLRDAAGLDAALPLAFLRLVPDDARPALAAAGLAALPAIPCGGSATVAFEAGFGPAWDDVPPDLAQAVLMLAAHYHDFRHDTGLGPGCMPFGVTALIERHRPLRVGGFA